MSGRKSRGASMMRLSQDKIVDHISIKPKFRDDDEYNEDNTSLVKNMKPKPLTKREREGMEAQRGRSLIYSPDKKDDIGWVPEKGNASSDPKAYQRWFRRNHKS